MRGSETQAFQAIDIVDGLEKLNERTLARDRRELVPPVKVHDLSQQRDFFHSVSDELAHFPHDFVN